MGGRKMVDSPLRRSANEIEDVIDMRWWWVACDGGRERHANDKGATTATYV